METGQNKTTESGKIRFYIMGLIYRYGNRSVRVPSSVELAERFGVARRTARLALEGLVREGWLIGRRGLGTYTNPARTFFSDPQISIPLVGLIYGRGDNFYYDTPACRMFVRAEAGVSPS
ncbi:MAG: DNA-binding transcriptional repressor LldR [Firmicutes bacterium ADurb.Bin467]|nr:MAG: DNA-binding transcriptional repressor LldR [Firmicutes bacterium ADurb.Bin467]